MNKAIRALANVGVVNPWDTGAKTVQTVLNAYLCQKTLNRQAFFSYLKMVNPSLGSLYSALETIVVERSRSGQKVADVIQAGLAALENTLNADANPEERAQVRAHIMRLMEMMCAESQGDRIFVETVVGMMGTLAKVTTLLAGAVIVLKYYPPASRPLFAKAFWLLKTPFV